MKKKLLLALSMVCVAATCLCACKEGVDGKDGEDGKSAYQIWVDGGNTGSQSDFIAWLKGETGDKGDPGRPGIDGKSAYQIWLGNGHIGTIDDFFAWLKGETGDKGDPGRPGSNGKSAYQVWLDNGHIGTEEEFLDWLKGENGLSSYELFLQQYPYYSYTEEQWMRAMANGELKIHTVTFKSNGNEDIVKYVLNGYELTDIPEVPKEDGKTGAQWSVIDFKNVTSDMEVVVLYDNYKTVTFHNEYTDEDDITITVNYGETIENIPAIAPKLGNSARWSTEEFDSITQDMVVNAIYETNNLRFSPIDNDSYCVTRSFVDLDTEELFIPAEHNGKPVTKIDDNAFSGEVVEYAYQKDNIKTVHIPDSVTSIGNKAFSWCAKLDRITIPNSVTSIGDNAFEYCDSLRNVTLSNNLNSIGSYAFGDCINLRSITIPDSVTSIGSSVFKNCLGLTSVVLSSNLNEIASGMFNNCVRLADITIPDSVSIIDASAFCNCSSLNNIILPNSVSNIGESAFYGCAALTNIVIPDSVKTMENNVFGKCFALKSIKLPNDITRIGLATFSDCYSLESITIPDSVTSIESVAFENCTSITNVTIGKNVKNIDGSAFSGCTGLETISVDNGNEKYHSDGNCIIETESKTLILGCNNSVIPADGSVVSIGNAAFRGCTGLKNIVIPNGVTNISDGAFQSCTGLETITVDNGNEKYHSDGNCIIETESKTLILGCNNSVISADGSVTSIGNEAFRGCAGLTSIVVPNGVTNIGYGAFQGCTGLTSIILPNSLTDISGAFDSDITLKNVYYHGTIEDWNNANMYNGILNNSTIYFYSESEPPLNEDGTAYDGTYWHFDNDGVTPVAWIKQ